LEYPVVNRQRGFTLVEIMVVVTIVALMISFGYLGFNQLLGRRTDEESQSLRQWLQSVSDRARLEGAVYGIQIEGEQLLPLTYRQGIWLKVLDQQVWAGDSEYQLEFVADGTPKQLLDVAEANDLQPSLIFLPDGTQWPEGKIRMSYETQTIWFEADDQGRFNQVAQ
jgi:prepilin-type N-terminal cleavage/methylation domain-containing protein